MISPPETAAEVDPEFSAHQTQDTYRLLRVQALEAAIRTAHADDKPDGSTVLDRAVLFLGFLSSW